MKTTGPTSPSTAKARTRQWRACGRSLGALAFLALLDACGDPIGKAWLVERPRVLAARVSVTTDSARATPAAGERAAVEWLLAAPGPLPKIGWSFAACVAPEGNYAAPRCDGDVVATSSGVDDAGASAPIRFELVTPDAPGAREILVLAAFCEEGAATLEPRAFGGTCANGVEPLLATATVRIARSGIVGADAPPNLNPAIAEDAIALAGDPAGPPVVLPRGSHRTAGMPCEPSLDAPFVATGSERAFAFAFGAREAGETLILSHAVTSGTLDRQYSALEADEAPRTVSIPWTAPVDVEASGRLVAIYFILRDGRGGTTFERRHVCVRRP